jgi:hypothetical protein
MALTLADFLSANPQLLAQIASMGNGGPTLGTMPVQQAPAPSIGTMPVPMTPLPANPAPGIQQPMPVPGQPPPLVGNGVYYPSTGVYHPERGTGYAPGGKNWYNTGLVRDYVSPQLPQGEYQRTLGQQGMADSNTRRGQFGLQQYADTQRRYQAAQLRNPALSFRDFLSQGGAGNLMDQWRGLSASARGLNPASRTSIVRWG